MRPKTGLALLVVAECELGFDSAAARISAARISPPGPDPRRSARLTPRSLARRRALGEILAACAEVDCDELVGWFAEADVRVAVVDFLPDAAASSSVGGTSPGRTIHAMVCPTGTSVPA